MAPDPEGQFLAVPTFRLVAIFHARLGKVPWRVERVGSIDMSRAENPVGCGRVTIALNASGARWA